LGFLWVQQVKNQQYARVYYVVFTAATAARVLAHARVKRSRFQRLTISRSPSRIPHPSSARPLASSQRSHSRERQWTRLRQRKKGPMCRSRPMNRTQKHQRQKTATNRCHQPPTKCRSRCRMHWKHNSSSTGVSCYLLTY